MMFEQSLTDMKGLTNFLSWRCACERDAEEVREGVWVCEFVTYRAPSISQSSMLEQDVTHFLFRWRGMIIWWFLQRGYKDHTGSRRA